MSLTLNEVRNIKFRMAKRSGYEVLDVDEFVDHVEEGLIQLVEENDNLKRQIDSLQSGQGQPNQGQDQASGSQANGGQAQSGEADRQSDQAGQSSSGQGAVEPAPMSRPDGDRSSTADTSSDTTAEKIVVTTSREASTAVVRLVQLSTEQAEKVVEEAEADASRIRDEANRGAHQVTTDARTRAERIESEARVNAERVRSDAQGRASQLDQDTDSRRQDLFGGLERERDQLSAAVLELREFEAQYRQNLTTHLQAQLEAVGNHQSEPGSTPALLSGPSSSAQNGDRGQGHGLPQEERGSADDQSSRGRRDPREDQSATNGGSETPRLDALLGDR